MVRELVAVISLFMKGSNFGTSGVKCSTTVTETRLVLSDFGLNVLSVDGFVQYSSGVKVGPLSHFIVIASNAPR